MTTVEHAWRIFKPLDEHWPTVPADDPGPKFPLDFSVRPSPRHEGAVIVMFRSTRKYQKEKWAAFAEAVELLAAAGYERLDFPGHPPPGWGVFRPAA